MSWMWFYSHQLGYREEKKYTLGRWGSNVLEPFTYQRALQVGCLVAGILGVTEKFACLLRQSMASWEISQKETASAGVAEGDCAPKGGWKEPVCSLIKWCQRVPGWATFTVGNRVSKQFWERLVFLELPEKLLPHNQTWSQSQRSENLGSPYSASKMRPKESDRNFRIHGPECISGYDRA